MNKLLKATLKETDLVPPAHRQTASTFESVDGNAVVVSEYFFKSRKVRLSTEMHVHVKAGEMQMCRCH